MGNFFNDNLQTHFERGAAYIIAEIGVNHEGSMEIAKRLIDEAKEGGADAAKFQTYKAGTIASKNSPAYWDTSKESTDSQFKLFQKYDGFGADQYKELSRYCEKVGIEFASTPFDLEAVDMLDPLMNYFKIASADITNLPLLRKVASKAKPVILSTGASNLSEIELALSELKQYGADEICLMHCILNYPTEDKNANLAMLPSLARSFPDVTLGYSDHTEPSDDMMAVIVAYLGGAMVIEKHFTHDKSLPGNDHYHAMDKVDLEKLRALLGRIDSLQGSADHKFALESEKPAVRNARRSIIAKHDLEPGHILGADDLICKRPGTGISPVHWDEILGRKLVAAVSEDEALSWSHFAEGP